MTNIRVGIAGCGQIALGVHLPVLSRIPNVEIAALADPDNVSLRAAASLAPQAETFDDAVREHIVEVLRETNGIVAGPRGAAVRLGLKRTTLLSKMQKLGITPADVVPAPLSFPVAQSARSIAV